VPNDAFTQQRLAEDKNFQLRVRHVLATVAWNVLTETPQPSNYVARASYARQVLGDLDKFTPQIARSLVSRPNVALFATSFDFQRGAVVTASGDPDLLSQLTTDWNHLAGA
jgi:hypothetical protein